MLAYSLASYANLVPDQLARFGIPAETKYQVSLLFRGGLVAQSMWSVVCAGYVVGGVKLKIKLNSAQLDLELGLNLAIYIPVNKFCKILFECKNSVDGHIK